MTGPTGADVYDYVVVGSGAGGGPVAANLAEAGHRVLLLEAGLDAEDDDYRVPAFHGRASEHPGMSWPFYVRHFDDTAQQERDEKYVPEQDGVLYPRSGTLGGCTAHNAMITVYPHDADWDGIAAATGDASWRSTQMRQWFERLEACQYKRRPRMLPKHPWLARLLAALPFLSDKYVNRSRHGFDGWLHTNLADPALALADKQVISVIKSAAVRSLANFLHRPLTPFEGLNSAVDPNDWRGRTLPEGLWLIPLAVRKGRRNGTRERIRDVEQRLPDRLVVRTGALVTRVLFDDTVDGDPVATGVEYLDQPHAYRADPEFAAADAPVAGPGAGTPRGDPRRRRVQHPAAAQALRHRAAGRARTVRHHAAAATSRASGRTCRTATRSASSPRCAGSSRCSPGSRSGRRARGRTPTRATGSGRSGKGVYTTNGALLGIIRRSRPDLTNPDLFIFGLPARFTGYFPGYSGGLAQQSDIFTWAILKAHTTNRAGSVLLRSADPRDTPDVRFRYFEEGDDAAGEDLDAVVTGIEMARSIMNSLGGRRRDRARARAGREHPRGTAVLRPRPGVGPPRLVHLRHRPGRRPAGRRRQRLPGARHAGAARGRRLGVPPHPRLLHRHRDLHGGREGQRRDPRRRREGRGRPRVGAVPHRSSARPRAAAPPAQALPHGCPPPRRSPGDPMSTETSRSTNISASVPQPRVDSDGHSSGPAAPAEPPPIPGKDYRRTPFWRIYDWVAQTIDHRRGWDKLPLPAGLAVLIGVRTILRQENLHDPSTAVPIVDAPPVPERTPQHLVARSVDGTYNDLDHPDDGPRRGALRAEHPARPGAAGDPRAADGAEPARGEPAAADARPVPAGDEREHAGRVLAAVHDPRLVHPRRE